MGTMIGCALTAVIFGWTGFVVGFVLGYDTRRNQQARCQDNPEQ